MIRVSSLSLQYVRYQVRATLLGADYNPTGDTVQFAFTDGSDPAAWVAGAWETSTDPDTDQTSYVARCLIGPGSSNALTKGKWYAWVKITDSPEVPVILAGTILVT